MILKETHFGTAPVKNRNRPPELLFPNPKAPLREQVREIMRFHH
jgi:hypothetical protein